MSEKFYIGLSSLEDRGGPSPFIVVTNSWDDENPTVAHYPRTAEGLQMAIADFGEERFYPEDLEFARRELAA